MNNQHNCIFNRKLFFLLSFCESTITSASELLKRLDDSSEDVRGVALQALGLWLSSLTGDYNPEHFTPHLQLLFQQLLLHLDDPDSSVQGRVLGETGWGV